MKVLVVAIALTSALLRLRHSRLIVLAHESGARILCDGIGRLHDIGAVALTADIGATSRTNFMVDLSYYCSTQWLVIKLDNT